ncbi:hypothetical protein JCM21900_006578 [Sporobolomyces salmonicolor]
MHPSSAGAEPTATRPDYFHAAYATVARPVVAHSAHRDPRKSTMGRDRLDRDPITEYNGSPELVFGVSFVGWVVWMLASFTLYFSAGSANLLAVAEFSWSFGTMISVPVHSPSLTPELLER